MIQERHAIKGDEVRVIFFGHSQHDMLYGTVEYTPQATGDSWIIVGMNGEIYHVQSFAVIEVLHRRVAPKVG